MIKDIKYLYEFIEDMPVGIARADSTGKLPNYFNGFFLNMFGWNTRDIDTLKKWFLRAYPDEHYRRKVLTQWSKAALETETKKLPFSSAMEVNVTCKDGSEKVCKAIYYRKEHFIHGIFVDVSEYKLIDNLLQDAYSSGKLSY